MGKACSEGLHSHRLKDSQTQLSTGNLQEDGLTKQPSSLLPLLHGETATQDSDATCALLVRVEHICVFCILADLQHGTWQQRSNAIDRWITNLTFDTHVVHMLKHTM